MNTRRLKSIAFSLVVFTLASAWTACNQKSAQTGQNGKSESATANETKTNTNTPTAKPMEEKKVSIKTDYGTMVVRLYNETPLHRDNFIKLAKEGYFNDLLFHRVIKGFMIQGGDPNSRGAQPGQMLGNGGPGYTIPAEFNTALYHKKGALAAARTGGPSNPKKESSGSQFYIVQGQVQDANMLSQLAASKGYQYTADQITVYTTVGGTPHLDMDYTVFGEVISGMEVIDKIAAVQTNPQSNRPVQDVKMTVTVME